MTEDTQQRIIGVIPAAGQGSRFQQQTPKQYLQIHGASVLEHSINALRSHPNVAAVVIAVQAPEHLLQQFPQLQQPDIHCVSGGSTRAASVLAGVEAALRLDATHVLVHDAARPCLPQAALQRLLNEGLAAKDGAILALPVADTIKRGNSQKQITASVARENLWRAQTPQLFGASTLAQALRKVGTDNSLITDEASAIEACGGSPLLVLGSEQNIKLTYPEDLALVAWYLTHQQEGQQQ